MSSKEKSTLPSDAMFQRLLKEAPFVAGDGGDFLQVRDIEWLDIKLFKEGQDFFKRNIFSVYFAHMVVLLFGFSFKNMTTILLRTGKFTTARNSVGRLFETQLHIGNWYDIDILGEKDKGLKDIQRVRKMHRLALKHSLQTPLKLFENVSRQDKKQELIEAMNKDLERFQSPETPLHLMTYNPTVLMSQFDMAMTQFGFFGLVYLFPDIYGINDTRGMDGFVHFWAVIGRLLGIQDRFNLALHVDRELLVKMFRIIILPALMKSDMTILSIQEDLYNAVGFGSLRGALYFNLMGAKSILPEYEGRNLYNILGWWDIFCNKVVQFLIFLMYHFELFRVGMNEMMNFFVSIYRTRH